MDQITITQPDDWHLHVRDGDVLTDVLADTARTFARAIIMPNLVPPVTTVEQALQYRARIMDNLPAGSTFEPLMTLYLTDNTTENEVTKAAESEFVHAVKYYPAGATTNSDSGVTDISHCYKTLEKMAELQLPLLFHGEVTSPDIDVFDREAVFIETILDPVLNKIPQLKVVLEHITTKQAVDYVTQSKHNLAATVTPHHLAYNRNMMFKGGMNPHYYCLPIIKRETHRRALINAATSGNSKFFLGTDSAPHAISAKESGCGCAGIYNAHIAMEVYADIFEQANALDKLEGFASLHGPAFYGLPVNSKKLTLTKLPQTVMERKQFGTQTLKPLLAGETIAWTAELSA